MTTSMVRDRQRPLRARYREQPGDAISRKWAGTSAAHIAIDDPFHGEVQVGRGYGVTFRYGIDRGIGGLHDLPNPGDMLCAALAACLDSTIRMLSDSLGVTLDDLVVEVDGEVDLRGTLMIDPEAAVGFRALTCTADIRAAAGTDAAKIAHLIELSERCCVNLATLRAGLDVATRTAGAADRHPEARLIRPAPHA